MTEDRLAGTEDLEVHPAREIRQHVLRQVIERRELVDQLGGLDPPGGLESEPDRPYQASDPSQEDPEQVEQPSDHRTGEEGCQQEEDLRADLALPEVLISSPKITCQKMKAVMKEKIVNAIPATA